MRWQLFCLPAMHRYTLGKLWLFIHIIANTWFASANSQLWQTAPFRHYLPMRWKFALVNVLFPKHIRTALAKVTKNYSTFQTQVRPAVAKVVENTLAQTKISPKREGKFCQRMFSLWRRNNALAIILPISNAQVCVGKVLTFHPCHCQHTICVYKAPFSKKKKKNCQNNPSTPSSTLWFIPNPMPLSSFFFFKKRKKKKKTLLGGICSGF